MCPGVWGRAVSELKDVPSFSAVVHQVRAGKLARELSDGLAAVVAAVMDTRKKGRLTLTLVVEPLDGATGSTVRVFDDVKLVVPQPARGSSVFFATDYGALSRHDWRQPSLEDLLLDIDQGVAGQVPATRLA